MSDCPGCGSHQLQNCVEGCTGMPKKIWGQPPMSEKSLHDLNLRRAYIFIRDCEEEQYRREVKLNAWWRRLSRWCRGHETRVTLPALTHAHIFGRAALPSQDVGMLRAAARTMRGEFRYREIQEAEARLKR